MKKENLAAMSEQSGLPLSTMGSVIERLPVTNYQIWALRMIDCLLCEGLWDLTTGIENDIVVAPLEATDYQRLEEKYLGQGKQIEKAIGMLRLEITDTIAVNYYSTL